MIHPSYVELMRVVNDDVVIGEEPVVNSRYSIVCATAKRARQLIDHDEPLHKNPNIYKKKPLSIAVEELYEGDLKILSAEEASEQAARLNELKEKNREAWERVKEVEAKVHAEEAKRQTAKAAAEEETFEEGSYADDAAGEILEDAAEAAEEELYEEALTEEAEEAFEEAAEEELIEETFDEA